MLSPGDPALHSDCTLAQPSADTLPHAATWRNARQQSAACWQDGCLQQCVRPVVVVVPRTEPRHGRPTNRPRSGPTTGAHRCRRGNLSTRGHLPAQPSGQVTPSCLLGQGRQRNSLHPMHGASQVAGRPVTSAWQARVIPVQAVQAVPRFQGDCHQGLRAGGEVEGMVCRACAAVQCWGSWMGGCRARGGAACGPRHRPCPIRAPISWSAAPGRPQSRGPRPHQQPPPATHPRWRC